VIWRLGLIMDLACRNTLQSGGYRKVFLTIFMAFIHYEQCIIKNVDFFNNQILIFQQYII